MSSAWQDADDAPQREGDDYDLMTYGEAAARLAELIAEEREQLAALHAAEPIDEAAVANLVERIELLEASNARYQQESLTADAFVQKFGFSPRR